MISQPIQQRIQEHGFSGCVSTEETSAVSCLEARTNLGTKEMLLRYNPKFAPQGKAIQRYAAIKQTHSPLESCLGDATGHECGHVHLKDGSNCPGTPEEHEEHFYAPIAEILQKKGKLAATDDLSNLVEDLINNTILRQHQSNKGLVLFYDDCARSSSSGRWDKAFEAYMRVQIYCWGDQKDKELLQEHFTSDEKVVQATRNIIQRLALKRREAAEYLKRKQNWKTVSTVVAEELADLIQVGAFQLCGFGKQMKEAMQDPTQRQKFAVQRYQQGQPAPAYMERPEALDHVYSFLAKQISLKVNSISRQESFPVVPFQHRPYDPEEDRPEQINWRRPKMVAESPFGGHLNFGVAQQHYELPLQVKLGMKSFPPLKFGLIDCSGTMELGLPRTEDPGNKIYIPWGDKSRYHYSCLAWYGLVEFLARQQILPNVEVSAGVFSDETRIGKGLQQAKEALLNPVFGNTYLDVAKVQTMFAGEKSVFFTISDGEVANWSTVSKEFIHLARQHHYFHLQIGPATAMTKALRKARLPVYPVKTGEDLNRLAIDLTREAYREHIEAVVQQLRGAS